jgi:cytochrome b6-f complex iron-sulfur subunit
MAMSSAPATDRRSYVLRLAGALGLLALAEGAWVLWSFLRPRPREAANPNPILVAGAVGDFAPGSVTPFPSGKLYLVRLDDGGFLALHRRCTHLGCTVPWVEKERRFVCPCHASAFDMRGLVLGPPAPRPLDIFPVRIENGVVKVDLRQPVARTAFSPDQVARS